MSEIKIEIKLKIDHKKVYWKRGGNKGQLIIKFSLDLSFIEHNTFRSFNLLIESAISKVKLKRGVVSMIEKIYEMTTRIRR